MLGYTIRRVAWTLVVVLIISFLTFFIFVALPPNNARTRCSRTAG